MVVANPPYMGSSNMNGWVSGWTKKRYKEVRKDLCTCFIKRGFSLSDDRGYEALITSDTCMYISSFEKMRKEVIERTSIVCFIDTRGTNAHPDVFDANAGWVLWNHPRANIKGSYFKLNHPIPEKGQRLLEALANPDCGWFYRADASGFEAIPGNQIVYWAKKGFYRSFQSKKTLAQVAEVKEGLKTSNNEHFIRDWYEVSFAATNVALHSRSANWIAHSKGGAFRRWYGNQQEVLWWSNNGADLRGLKSASITGEENYFKTCISWNRISSDTTGFRYYPDGFIPNMAGLAMYVMNSSLLNTLLGYLNSSVVTYILDAINPTLNYPPGAISQIPLLISKPIARVDLLVEECIAISKQDWNSFETSWDFKQHPLV